MTEFNNINKSYWKRTESQLMKHISRCDFCRSTFSYSSKISNHNEISIIRFPICCKTYFCEYCSVSKKIKLRKKLNQITFNNRMRFLTLTLSTNDFSPEEALTKISYFFNRLCKELRRRGFKFQFFKIIELTKRHQAHIHALISCYIDVNIIRSIWKSLTGSYQVFIKAMLDKPMMIQYLIKYLTKSVNNYANYLFYLLSKRRYSFSQFLFQKVETLKEFIFSNKFFFSLVEIIPYVKNLYLDKFFDTNYFKIHFIT